MFSSNVILLNLIRQCVSYEKTGYNGNRFIYLVH